jgi:hypothetical protein
MTNIDQKAATPPYLSLTQFKNFIDHLAESGVPKKIDNAVMGSLNGSSRTALSSGLRFLGLVAEDGSTHSSLRALVDAKKASEADWQRALRETIDRAYAGIVEPGIDFEQETWRTLEDAFKKAGVREGQMSEKCLRFFVTAHQEAGTKLGSHILNAPGRTTGGVKRSPPKKRSSAGGGSSGSGSPGTASGGERTPDTTPTGYIDQAVFLPGREKPALLRFPADITERELALLEHAIVGVKLYALPQKGGPP